MLEPESVTVAVDKVLQDVLRLEVSGTIEDKPVIVVRCGYSVLW
jgi:hypothetical protein